MPLPYGVRAAELIDTPLLDSHLCRTHHIEPTGAVLHYCIPAADVASDNKSVPMLKQLSESRQGMMGPNSIHNESTLGECLEECRSDLTKCEGIMFNAEKRVCKVYSHINSRVNPLSPAWEAFDVQWKIANSKELGLQ